MSSGLWYQIWISIDDIRLLLLHYWQASDMLLLELTHNRHSDATEMPLRCCWDAKAMPQKSLKDETNGITASHQSCISISIFFWDRQVAGRQQQVRYVWVNSRLDMNGDNSKLDMHSSITGRFAWVNRWQTIAGDMCNSRRKYV